MKYVLLLFFFPLATQAQTAYDKKQDVKIQQLQIDLNSVRIDNNSLKIDVAQLKSDVADLKKHIDSTKWKILWFDETHRVIVGKDTIKIYKR